MESSEKKLAVADKMLNVITSFHVGIMAAVVFGRGFFDFFRCYKQHKVKLYYGTCIVYILLFTDAVE